PMTVDDPARGLSSKLRDEPALAGRERFVRRPQGGQVFGRPVDVRTSRDDRLVDTAVGEEREVARHRRTTSALNPRRSMASAFSIAAARSISEPLLSMKGHSQSSCEQSPSPPPSLTASLPRGEVSVLVGTGEFAQS